MPVSGFRRVCVCVLILKTLLLFIFLHCHHRMPEVGNHAKEKKMYDVLFPTGSREEKKEEYFVFISRRRNIVT